MDFRKLQADTERFKREIKGLSDRVIEPDEPLGFQGLGYTFGDEPPKLKEKDYLMAATSWVYAAVSAIADAIAKLHIELYKVNASGDVEEVESHPVLDLLYKVNNFQTFVDHIWLTAQYLELTGEAPWFVDRGSGKTLTAPQNIMLLRPDRLYIKKAPNGTDASAITGYEYRLDNGQKIELKNEEVILIKYPDPVNPFRGKGTLQAAATTYDVDTFSEEYNKKFFYNGARPDSVLSTEQVLSKVQRQNLRAEIDRLYKGTKNANKTAILEKGLKWSPMSVSAKDADFIEQMKFSRDKILSIFRVPKSIVSITEDVNLANAEVAEYVFTKWTIKPKLERLAAQLNEFLLPMFPGTENLFLTFEEVVDEDTEVNLKVYDNALKNGWMTVNEVRADQNLPDVGPDGDVLLVPATVRPIDQANNPAGPIPPVGLSIKTNKSGIVKARIIARAGNAYYRALRMARAKKIVKGAVKKLEGKIAKIAKDALKEVVATRRRRKEAEKQEMDDKKKAFVTDTVKRFDRYENYVKNTQTLIFREQAKKVLAKFPKKSIKALDPTDYLLDPEAETQTMVRIYDPIIRQIVTEQGRQASKLVLGRAAFDLATKPVQEYLANRAYDFSFPVNEETNTLIGNTLAEGVANGEGMAQLRRRISSLFTDMETYRSERIARSEVIRASGFATNEAYQQAGVERNEWHAYEDGTTCEFCQEMEDKYGPGTGGIPTDSTFLNEGDKLTGRDGGSLSIDYGAVQFPPLHVNCRCTLLPVIKY